MDIKLLLFIVMVSQVDCMDLKSSGKKFCREELRLVASEELDEYLLVEAEINSTIILECRFCKDKNKEQLPKIWYWQDPGNLTIVREVELDMENNASLNRIYVTSEISLVISYVLAEDVGIYRCFGLNGLEQEYKFNYRLELVLKDDWMYEPEKGNITEWEKYREINLMPVTLRLAVSRMKELRMIRDAGIQLEVISEWGIWGPCEECVLGRGIKTKEAYCRIKRHFTKVKSMFD